MDFAHLLTDTYAIVLVSVGIVALVYVAVDYGLTFFRVGKTARKAAERGGSVSDEQLPPVSVVLVTQNNADMMRQHIANILEQDYPNYEIVVVDYQSHDDTSFVLQLCAANYPNLKRVFIQRDVNFFQGKKYPLSLGIKSAQSDIILLTDADCEPPSFNWIRSMVSAYTGESDKIVLGYNRLRAPKSLLGHLQQYDNLVYNCEYLSAAIGGHPYTGCGRNLSYRRSFFFENDGFIRHYAEPGGADDMFVNLNARRGNTAVALSPEAMVEVDAAGSFSDWSYLRRQRVITRCYYTLLQRLSIKLRPLMLALFYVACGLMFAAPAVPWIIPAVLLLLKFGWQIVAVAQSQSLFRVRNYHWAAPLLELYFLFADTILSIITLHRKRCSPRKG